MIRAESLTEAYQVQLDNGVATVIADTTADKGGCGEGFRPHDLLEAALASCTLITLRMYAEKHDFSHVGIGVEVTLNRANPEAPVFECMVSFPADFPAERRTRMLEIAGRCPVHKTLASALAFKIDSRG